MIQHTLFSSLYYILLTENKPSKLQERIMIKYIHK